MKILTAPREVYFIPCKCEDNCTLILRNLITVGDEVVLTKEGTYYRGSIGDNIGKITKVFFDKEAVLYTIKFNDGSEVGGYMQDEIELTEKTK